MYHSVGEFLEECFEVKGIGSITFANLIEEFENKLEFGVKTKGFGGHENISDVSSSLSGV